MKAKRAFTIVETLIALAVTSALLLSALAMINGRQGKTQFSTGLREIEGLLRDQMNDVSSGILPDITGMQCSAPMLSGAKPTFSYAVAAGDTVGSKEECVLAGKMIVFGTDTNNEKYVTYAVAGRRLNTAGDPVTNFDELKQSVVFPSNASGVNSDKINSKDEKTLPWGIRVVKSDSAPSAAAFAIMYKDFRGQNLGQGQISSGNSSIGILPILSAATDGISNAQEDLLIAKLEAVKVTGALSNAAFLNQGETITLCLESQTSNQYAVVTLGITGVGFEVNSEVVGKSDLVSRNCY